MADLLVVAMIVTALVLLDLAALLWGADSRPSAVEFPRAWWPGSRSS